MFGAVSFWSLKSIYIQIAVFAGGVDTSATETKGTVLIHSAEQVRSYHDEFFPLTAMKLFILYSFDECCKLSWLLLIGIVSYTLVIVLPKAH